MRYLIIPILVVLTSLCLAQGSAVTGTVHDEQNAPVPYASVALYNAKDSSLVSGAASNDQGVFNIIAKNGTYYLLVRFLSFKDKTVSGITVNGSDVDLGTIRLESGVKTLEEFTVEADKPQMELKLDKRVFNVSQNVSNTGANAAEVLDNIPSVEVDVEGNVSLRGSENVRILIDGKPSGLTGISSADALRMLQGDLVESVEVITNPSARYDAEGEVGIINIILKKEKRKGLNGSLEVRGGVPENYGASVNVNVRRKTANFFASYGTGYRDRPGGGTLHQEWDLADTSYSYDRDQQRNRTDFSHNFRLGTDIDLTQYSTVTVAGSYSRSNGENTTEQDYRDYNENGLLTQTVERDETEDENDEDREVRFSYRKAFKRNKDQLLTVDMQYDESSETEDAILHETSDDITVEPIIQRTGSDNSQVIRLFQSDYVHPFKKDGKFETGVKVSMRTFEDDYRLEEQKSDATWDIVPGYNNFMIYTENIYAAYMMIGNKKKKLSYQAGLRAEYSDITTDFRQTNDVNHRDYLNFFPSAHFSYEKKEGHFYQLSYSRRISRPRHWWLMPFFGFTDSRNVFSGNPNINPEFTHSFEIGHLRQGNKGNVLSSIYYRHTDGLMDRIVLSDSAGRTSNFPVNLGTENSYGLEFSGSYHAFQWWTVTGNFNFYRSISDGTYEGVRYTNDAYAWSTRLSSNWKVKRKFSCQSSVDYRSPRRTNQGEALSYYVWDVGAALDILKGDGTLTLSVRDVLNSRKRRHISRGENFVSESEFQWRSRQLVLSFSYRLNQKKRENRRGNGDYEGGDFDGDGM